MRRISSCLNPNLQKIYEKSLDLAGLNQKILQYLPLHLRPHCLVANFNKGQLLISTKKPNIANQLRYFLPELRDTLRKEAKLYHLISIKISLDMGSTPINTVAAIPKKASPLSMHAKEEIKKVADNCSYLPLKEKLLALTRDKGEEKK